MSTTTKEQVSAMLEFLGTFETLSGPPPDSLEELSDGVAIFEAFSEFSPNHFEPTAIARHLGDNWALKSSNLRKLVRNMDHYFKAILVKDASSVLQPLDVLAMAKDPMNHESEIAALVELLAAAAVTCPTKQIYVARIMQMSGESQVGMKSMIQTSMGRLTTYDGPLEDDPSDGHDDDEDADLGEVVFGRASDDYYDDDDGQVPAPKNLFGSGNHQHLSVVSPAPLSTVARLEEDLEQTKRQVSSLKSQMQLQQQDSDRAQDKLRSMVEDLQDRLVKRQDQLIQVEEDLQKAVSELEETKGSLVDAREESAQLADDLDVAQARARQVNATEATLQMYKKKIEQMGGMTQQMKDSEDQSANFVQQIVELEGQVKRLSAAQKQVEQLSEQVRRLEKERDGLEAQYKTSANDIAELKSQLKAANASKRSLEDELREMQAKQEAEMIAHSIPSSPQAKGFEDDMKQELQSKVSRLEVENETLRRDMERLKIGGGEAESTGVIEQPATPAASAVAMPAEENDALHAIIQQLKAEVAQKEAENQKVISDKDKLEAYTKRTLAKFQDKYLVALQECKIKLKEKQDKIEALEQRSTSERAAQKREERLLSSTIYELGMAIMQSRLKER